MIKFVLLLNKQGHTRLSQYYEDISGSERVSQEADIIRKCLSRGENQCSFMEYKNFKIVYRRYASLYFVVGVDNSENEVGIYEFIHNLVETYDRYFDSVAAYVRTVHFLNYQFTPNIAFALELPVHVYSFIFCELDIMFNLEKAYIILDEMIMNGNIIGTNRNRVLAPIIFLDKGTT